MQIQQRSKKFIKVEAQQVGGNAIGFLFDDNTRINVNYPNAKERDEDFENIFKKHLTNNA